MHGIAFGRDVETIIVAVKNSSRGNAHGAHAGERGNFIPSTIREGQRLPRCAAVQIWRHLELQHVAGVHA